MSKHLLEISSLSKKEITEILSLSKVLQDDKNAKPLEGKNILFAFEKPSLRTRVATECAINHLGGCVINAEPQSFFEISSKDGVFKYRESLKDTVNNATQWCDAIFARVFSDETILKISQLSSIPVINALCDKHHPMQALSDLFTINEHFGARKISLAFVGDACNVARSLFEILIYFGHEVRFVSPEKYSFSNETVSYFNDLAQKHSAKAIFSNNPKEVVDGVDVVYADTFISMGEESIFDEKIAHFSGYQVNSELFNLAKKDAIFMHCLPAHRNVEVTDEVMDSKNSIIYQQAKNRMVVSKGVFTKFINS